MKSVMKPAMKAAVKSAAKHAPRRRAQAAFSVGAGLALLVGCSEPAGLRVNVDLGQFAPVDVSELRLTFNASPGGFGPNVAPSVQTGVNLALGDSRGDKPLIMTFSAPGTFHFEKTFAFRLETQNQVELMITADAAAFQLDGALMAAAHGAATLPTAGHGTLALVLEQRSGTERIDTVTTDLAVNDPDFTVKGFLPPTLPPSLAPASCDVDGDGVDDLVMGFPSAQDGRGIGSSGAVVAVLSRRTPPASARPNVDLTQSQQGEEFHVFGVDGGDQLGAAVACADLDNDGFGDIIAGAPQAAGGTGRVYVIFGRQSLYQTSVNLASETNGADLQWTTATAGARLGQGLFATRLGSEKTAVVLMAAAGTLTVHLATPPPTGTKTVDLDTFAHPTFVNVAAKSLAVAHLAGTGAALDVALGDPDARPPGSTAKSGIVYVFHDVALSGKTVYAVGGDASTKAPALTLTGRQDGGGLGTALLGADTTGMGEDLFVGAPGASDGAGEIYILANDNEIFDVASLEVEPLKYKFPKPEGAVRFGAALAPVVSGSTGAGTRLAVGAPRSGADERGAAYLFDGDRARTFHLIEQMLGAAAQDHLGSLVGGGRLGLKGADAKGDLVAGATGTGQGAAVFNVRFAP